MMRARLVADSQYSSSRVRDLVSDSVIPYTANQSGDGVLRVDRRFRTHGPEELVAEYHKRPLIESVFSWLKDQYGFRVNNVRRIGNVSVYALLSLLCHVLVREAAEGLGKPEKACLRRSSTCEGLSEWFLVGVVSWWWVCVLFGGLLYWVFSDGLGVVFYEFGLVAGLGFFFLR